MTGLVSAGEVGVVEEEGGCGPVLTEVMRLGETIT